MIDDAGVTPVQRPVIDRDELGSLVDWVSSNAAGENAAYVEKATGRIICIGEGADDAEEVPDDIEDSALFAPVPAKHDLNLGKALVLNFADEYLRPHADEIRRIFSHAGAYSRFKTLLHRLELTDRWYAFEAEATERRLEEWATDNGFRIGIRSR
jgi:hypothetical protein